MNSGTTFVSMLRKEADNDYETLAQVFKAGRRVASFDMFACTTCSEAYSAVARQVYEKFKLYRDPDYTNEIACSGDLVVADPSDTSGFVIDDRLQTLNLYYRAA
ncbi:hypothetical protein H4R18_002017 [Coemansia javaensis]|uniref:Uncharacterized protein n=1 Tax=Coemansia javaensis TaxID=2761396 RepID=A0A9W8HDE2_9FUNG|nr:hypothetical protein H4R18_002017 [Coemansia javaensis]